MSRNIIGQTSAPLYTVGDREDKTVKIRWKDGPRFCQICGKELTGRKQHYCSTECKAEGKRRLTEEYHAKARAQKAKIREENEKIRAEKNTTRPEKRTACICCGQPIPKGRIIFCSDRCSRIWESSPYHEQTEAKKEAKKKRPKAMTWKQIMKGMAETGLQYGEYVARYEEGKK